ncbi:GNAT family N-acetyltransferase [Paraflavisolibacter sp. H34]|uniref:GNAT family N-acetyltransferase n=1 Tax=Huijunlia imazamoxiresistens TaxID=3127457 RepID=UPI0030161E53
MVIKEIRPEATWPIRLEAMWPGKPLEFVQLSDDASGVHYGLFAEGALVSVVSCFEKNRELQFRKLATLPHQQGNGYGSRLLQHVLDEARRKSIARVWCNARVNKKAFYEKFGLTDTHKRFSKEGIEFTIMELVSTPREPSF